MSLPETDTDDSRCIGVVILNYNTCEETEECVKLLKSDRRNRFKVAVLDNGSVPDESTRLARELGQHAILLRSERNLGYALGCDVVAEYLIRELRPSQLLFLNSDARITWTQIETLGRVLDEVPRAAAAGPRIMLPDGSCQSAGGFANLATGNTEWLHTPLSSRPYEVGALHGSVMLLRVEAWIEIGPFDTDYFLYSEETDWCLRALGHDRKLLCVPETGAVHKVRGSTHGKVTPLHVYYWTRNRILLVRKQNDGARPVAFAFNFSLYFLRSLLSFVARWNFEKAEALIRGALDGIAWKASSNTRSEIALTYPSLVKVR